ncbi:hypothetical protein BG95_08650 [Thermosipho sp. 1063]|uniref:hypothetical protein n=1 Tax=unclassified Thermosipho (in: thermotogales) TaxID=2676525 RepID=UPI000949234C|nr:MULTISPECIES: hypothetical protein [unclassified Thermosipho (in: thermotogales)]ANQ54684.1 hypothetical protein Y592_08755 [Thermosipho sp. 1070]APT73075.1 hypothetical protein BG95_08650 [Thermosipho sp. 1063]OOC42338.1 hypothetical protein XO08_08705 [Thermosipho sp. 1074]
MDNFTKEDMEKVSEAIFLIDPEAIFASNDEIAFGFGYRAKQLGHLPIEIHAIVGFDDDR